MENILYRIQEVDQVKPYRCVEVPTDPMSMEEIDMIIKQTEEEWVNASSKRSCS